MARHRLINCEFINASSFKTGISNKAKLLYLMMITSADDRGFVDTTDTLISSLTNNENEYESNVSLDLLENSYKSALNELLDKGYVYEFKDNHSNKVHLIRHWFFHNKLIKGLWTNYKGFLNQVYLDENEYILGKKPLKENKPLETNINKDNDNGVGYDLNETKKTKKPKKELGENELNPDDYPFELE